MSIAALKSGVLPTCPNRQFENLQQTISGINFPNPLGIAAGYDKNGEVPDALLRLGFGFAEVGTITPRPQAGNPRPRIFRLVEDEAIINRLGFNNLGHEAALQRLRARRPNGILGINIGANKDSDDFIADYVKGIEVFASFASYFTVNISSPNTPGLRDLQSGEALERLLNAVLSSREMAISEGRSLPVFLKIAPDIDDTGLDEIARVVATSPLDGMIISNTTTDRAVLGSRAANPQANEQGGLSGKPLFEKSTIVLAKMRQRLPPAMPIIGVGGIDSAKAAIAKLEAGAHLLQLYTGLIYKGPGLPREILTGISEHIRREGLDNVSELVGRKTDIWANR